MVNKLTNVTSLTGNGVRDWLIQRVTAVVLAFYILFLVGYLMWHPQLQYAAWRALFQNTFFRITSILFLLSLAWHSWIGIWTIITDYIKADGLRLGITLLVIMALFVYVIWGVDILWSA